MFITYNDITVVKYKDKIFIFYYKTFVPAVPEAYFSVEMATDYVIL